MEPSAGGHVAELDGRRSRAETQGSRQGLQGGGIGGRRQLGSMTVAHCTCLLSWSENQNEVSASARIKGILCRPSLDHGSRYSSSSSSSLSSSSSSSSSTRALCSSSYVPSSCSSCFLVRLFLASIVPRLLLFLLCFLRCPFLHLLRHPLLSSHLILRHPHRPPLVSFPDPAPLS